MKERKTYKSALFLLKSSQKSNVFYSRNNKKNIFGSFWLENTFFFWFCDVIFAWIKVANVQSQFSPTPLEVLTWFKDWELGQSVSFKMAQKLCAIFCAIFFKTPEFGRSPEIRELATALHGTSTVHQCSAIAGIVVDGWV